MHSLSLLSSQVEEDDLAHVEEVAKQVDELHNSSREVHRSVQPVHHIFLEATQKKLIDFAQTVDRFHSKFFDQGPDAVEDDLERGIDLVDVIFI